MSNGMRINHSAVSAGADLAQLDTELNEIITRTAKRVTMKRKTQVAMTSLRQACLRVEKMYANEQLTIGEGDLVEFEAAGQHYAGRKVSTTIFPDEIIIILEV